MRLSVRYTRLQVAAAVCSDEWHGLTGGTGKPSRRHGECRDCAASRGRMPAASQSPSAAAPEGSQISGRSGTGNEIAYWHVRDHKMHL